jgi:hypothetical protein
MLFLVSSFFSVAKIPDTLDIYGYIAYTSVKYQGISTDYPHSGQNIFPAKFDHPPTHPQANQVGQSTTLSMFPPDTLAISSSDSSLVYFIGSRDLVWYAQSRHWLQRPSPVCPNLFLLG